MLNSISSPVLKGNNKKFGRTNLSVYEPHDEATRKKLSACGGYTVYVKRAGGNYPVLTRTCSLSVCQYCASRLDEKRRLNVSRNMGLVLKEFGDDLVLVALTITNKVLDVQDVRRRVRRDLNKLLNMRETVAYGNQGELGYMRSVELKEVAEGRVNAHVHVLIAFKKGHLNMGVLNDLSNKYFHSFDLRMIQPQGQYKELSDSIIAYACYISKSFSSVCKEGRLGRFFGASVKMLSNMIKYASGGIFRGVFSDKSKGVKRNNEIKDGEKIWLKSRLSGRVIESVYDKTKGVFASFFGGGKRGRKKVGDSTDLDQALKPPQRAIEPQGLSAVGGYGRASENRVAAALDAFDKILAADMKRAKESNDYLRGCA